MADPFINLEKDTDNFIQSIKKNVRKISSHLDEKLKILSNFEHGIPAAAEFSDAKEDIFESVKTLMNTTESEWLSCISDIKISYIKNLQCFLENVKLSVKLDIPNQTSVPKSPLCSTSKNAVPKSPKKIARSTIKNTSVIAASSSSKEVVTDDSSSSDSDADEKSAAYYKKRRSSRILSKATLENVNATDGSSDSEAESPPLSARLRRRNKTFAALFDRKTMPPSKLFDSRMGVASSSRRVSVDKDQRRTRASNFETDSEEEESSVKRRGRAIKKGARQKGSKRVKFDLNDLYH